MNFLSSYNRPHLIKQLSIQYYDLVVVGGGITGSGIALDAASRGMKVALLEKNDFAFGTSSRSTKLIHGGLRYLKQFEIALVREVGRERVIIHRLAPHLVTSEKMLLPLIKDGTYSKLMTSVGLFVYDLLAGVEDRDRHVMLSEEEARKKEPLMRQDILKGAGLYAEYRTDDARLTIEVIKKAFLYGAHCINYVQVENFIYEKGRIAGVKAQDMNSNKTWCIRAKYVVSATGPWVDQLRKKDEATSKQRLFLSKGVHIVVDHIRFPIQQAIYFDIPDGRMIFAVPRGKSTYIGTTDTHYKGDINHVCANKDDVAYLIDATNHAFPSVQLTFADVRSNWAGLRPLIFEEGKSSSQISRKDQVIVSAAGLISIAGGKLTGYRKMAQKIVNIVNKAHEKDYNQAFKSCYTDKIHLGGSNPFTDADAVTQYTQDIQRQTKYFGLSTHHARYLVSNFGKQSEDILAKIPEKANDNPEVLLARAELNYTLENEMVFTPMDYFMRRTGRYFFDIESVKKIYLPILQDFHRAFKWDAATLECNRAIVEESIYLATHFE